MTQNTITISILIPVYNVADYLNECLQSILSQIDGNAEIIIINDASTDNSWEILQTYANHPQISLINAPHNRRLAITRNELLKLARHDYIWFIDSDDVMHSGAYQAVVQQLQQMPVDVLFGDYLAWRGNIKKYKTGFYGKANQYYTNDTMGFFKNLIKKNSNYVWNKILKKSILNDIQFKNGLTFEDIYYMADLSKFVKSYSYCKFPLIDYREREGSIVKVKNQKYFDDYLNAYIYREKVWHDLVADANKDDYSYYLWHKTFNRYVGVLEELHEANDTKNLAHVTNTYQATYLIYYQQALQGISWWRRLRMQKQYRKVMRLSEPYLKHT